MLRISVVIRLKLGQDWCVRECKISMVPNQHQNELLRTHSPRRELALRRDAYIGCRGGAVVDS